MPTEKYSKNIYRLPFDARFNLEPQPASYHDEIEGLEQALDFAMCEGTRIYAAQQGIVVDQERRFSKNTIDKKLADRCNFILLQHDKGEYTHYVHLQKNGVVVEKGQCVRQGELIGYSGMTGYATYPHLHFAVLDETGKTIIPRIRKGKRVVALKSPRKK